jgi:hypothetical protein
MCLDLCEEERRCSKYKWNGLLTLTSVFPSIPFDWLLYFSALNKYPRDWFHHITILGSCGTLHNLTGHCLGFDNEFDKCWEATCRILDFIDAEKPTQCLWYLWLTFRPKWLGPISR